MTYEAWRISFQSSEQAARAAYADNARLRRVIQKTLDENGHLADGEDCTLMPLKRVLYSLFGIYEEWQPIETAPRDKRVMVWSGQEIYCAHWAQNPITGDEAWIVAEWGTEGDQALVKPTRWRPLPMPPNAELNGARSKFERGTSDVQ